MTDRLYRSRDDRMLAGVAGGVAEMLDADPSIIRIVWAVLVVLTGGIALLVYIVMAIVVPERPEGMPIASPWAPGGARRRRTLRHPTPRPCPRAAGEPPMARRSRWRPRTPAGGAGGAIQPTGRAAG